MRKIHKRKDCISREMLGREYHPHCACTGAEPKKKGLRSSKASHEHFLAWKAAHVTNTRQSPSAWEERIGGSSMREIFVNLIFKHD